MVSCVDGAHACADAFPLVSINVFKCTDRCLCFSNGIAVHYKRGGFTTWQTITTGLVLKTSHVIGCGYTRSEENVDKGSVYFTHNGQRLPGCLNDVRAGLWPVVHLQKKVSLSCVVLGSIHGPGALRELSLSVPSLPCLEGFSPGIAGFLPQ